MKPLTIVNLFILILIISIPFIDYSKYLKIFDMTLVKVGMLILIALSSLLSLEVSILLTILFFLIIINGNVYKLSKVKELVKEKALQEANQASSIVATATPNPKETFIMTEFPEEKCDMKKPKPLNAFSYYLDDKIKPYEEYVKIIAGSHEIVESATGGFEL